MVGGSASAGWESLLEAELFGPYRLDELIGRGGMGEVFRAFDTKRDRAVALKRLPAALGADAEFVARFRREAAIAARLRAPHVVPIHDYGDIDGRLFIDMRLVSGTDLGRLLAGGGPLEPARAVGIVAQVASALDDAHAEGLAHRDVKPSNVLLTGNDFAYLADFGVVREVSGGPALTRTGAMVGTLAYMAPERFQGQSGDHLADIYALSCVLYESLTGRPPFGGQGAPALMYAHLHQAPPQASTQQRGVPAALDEVIARGMAKDPRQRFATAGELASAASTALRGPVSTAPSNDRPTGVSTIVRVPAIPDTTPGPAKGDTTQQQPTPPPAPTTPQPTPPPAPTTPPPAPTTPQPTPPPKPQFTPLFKPQPTPKPSPTAPPKPQFTPLFAPPFKPQPTPKPSPTPPPKPQPTPPPTPLTSPPSAQKASRGSVLTVPATLLVLLAAVAVTAFFVKPWRHDGGEQSEMRSSAPPPTAELKRFYGQSLSWSGCSPFAQARDDKKAYADPGLQCAYLTVPLDYEKPNGRTIQVGLLRRLASDQAHRIGSLVLNPGGPGLSGMSFAANQVDRITNNDIGQRFDFVGFDPRGVGSSKPQIVCRTPAEWDAERLMNLGVDTSPAGVAKTETQEKADNQGCVDRTGKDVLANIGTRDVVRDLDIMRSALGDEKLTYLGYGYGTRIGATYAEAFPKNVRAMILDGGIDLAQDLISQNIDQNRGFQQAFEAFVAWCVRRPDCGLGTDKDRAMSRYQELVRSLITQPVRVSGERRLSYTDATFGTTQALYSSNPSLGLWRRLDQGLQELAQNRPADSLMYLADLYYRREEDGSYSNVMDVFQAVRCIDYPPIKDPTVARNADAQSRKNAQFLDSGQPPSSALDNCAFWPVPPTSEPPHHPRIPDLPAVMVISTTQDPATPYQAGVHLADDLKAHLLTNEDTQSTAFLQGNDCVDHYGVHYLTDRALPPEKARCVAKR
jgi:serine/threonine protein kinase/pimeloyl-ACP methyl ester carboxylesterase